MSPRERLTARVRESLGKRVVMPRWAVALDFVYRAALLAGAVIVAVLWWQAATRDEEADRNARIQSCASVYAATYSAWDAEANELFGQLIAASVNAPDADPDLALVGEYTAAVTNAAEMAGRRIGLGIFSAQSVMDGNNFECPPLPDRLMVEPIAP